MKKQLTLLFIIFIYNIHTFSISHSLSFDSVWVYELTADGLIITGYKGEQEELILPSSINDEQIIGIGNYAFYLSTVKKVILPEGIRFIGISAFESSTLEYIELPQTLTTIFDNAFADSSLKKIVLPDSVKYIGFDAFGGSCIEYVYLSSSLQFIPDKCFHECLQLKEISIPSNVLAIGSQSFYGCINLQNVYFSSGIVSIGDDAFSGCNQLITIELPEGLFQIGESCFQDCESLLFVTIPSTVIIQDTGWGYELRYIFHNCPNLTLRINHNASFEKWAIRNNQKYVKATPYNSLILTYYHASGQILAIYT